MHAPIYSLVLVSWFVFIRHDELSLALVFVPVLVSLVQTSLKHVFESTVFAGFPFFHFFDSLHQRTSGMALLEVFE